MFDRNFNMARDRFTGAPVGANRFFIAEPGDSSYILAVAEEGYHRVHIDWSSGRLDPSPYAPLPIPQSVLYAQATALHANGRDYWIFNKPVYVSGLTACQFIGGQVQPPVYSPCGRVSSVGYDLRIRSSPNSEFVVLTGISFMEVFKLNRNTGALSQLFRINSSSPNSPQIGAASGISF